MIALASHPFVRFASHVAAWARAGRPVRLIGAVTALAAAVALVATLWLAAGPFLALYQIKSAVDRHDAARLAELVSFPTLRARVRARHAPVPDAAAGVFASLAAAIKGKAVDLAVDRLVTPAMLARALYGRRVWQAVRGEPVDGVSPRSLGETLSRLRFDYEGPAQFTLRIRDDDGAESALVLVREAGGWKIGDVVLAP